MTGVQTCALPISEADGAAQLDELQHRHIALGQQIAELRLREQQLANG